MKLHRASLHEIRRIAIGTGILDVLMMLGLFLLSSFGIGTFQLLPIVLATLGGSLLAIASFTFLCITVQQAVEIEDKKKMQTKFQLSYNIRMVVQAAWVLICYLTPNLHLFAGVLPLFFPKLTILYLNFTGKLLPKNETTADPKESSDDPEEEQP